MPTGGFAHYESDCGEMSPAWLVKMGIPSYLGCLIPCMSSRVVRTHEVAPPEERAFSAEAAVGQAIHLRVLRESVDD
jgi:hypothetical protein